MNKCVKLTGADYLRKLIIGWIFAVTVCFYMMPVDERSLIGFDTIIATPMLKIGVFSVVTFVILLVLGIKFRIVRVERWIFMVLVFLMALGTVYSSFSIPYLCVMVLLCGICFVYAVLGYDDSELEQNIGGEHENLARIIVVGIGVVFFVYVSAWTICRVLIFYVPTYDFGLFSQMFYYMKETGLPLTTLERDGLLSHFCVHVSPIYYLMLPFYCLYPEPVTLQFLQAAVMASAGVPLWKISRKQGFPPIARLLFCVLLFMYPAFVGGAGFDLHENVFLAPLILWLLYALECRKTGEVILFALLVLTVKEDAAVYVAVIGLYYIIYASLKGEKVLCWNAIAGGALFAGALGWFVAVTTFLAKYGDGVMTSRYSNFDFDGSGLLIGVVKSAVISPFKVFFESVDADQVSYILITLGPLLLLPLLTRKYERYILLIPYILVNLMSDYIYQHHIYYQYSFGTSVLLIYLTILNLADIQAKIGGNGVIKRYAILVVLVLITTVAFVSSIWSVGTPYITYYKNAAAEHNETREFLSRVPDEASVATTTWYTTALSQRKILYDIGYTTKEKLTTVQYVVLDLQIKTAYKNYATNAKKTNGLKNIQDYLEANGYELIDVKNNEAIIYRQTSE